MKNVRLTILLCLFIGQVHAQDSNGKVYPSNTEIVNPVHKTSFNNGNECPERKQGGNPQMVNGYQIFNGSMCGPARPAGRRPRAPR